MVIFWLIDKNTGLLLVNISEYEVSSLSFIVSLNVTDERRMVGSLKILTYTKLVVLWYKDKNTGLLLVN